MYNLAGKLTLGGLFALLDEAGCLITNDTGPMHIAWALGTPTVSLFGPVDPNHYGWQGSRVAILYKRIYCSPCVHEVDEPPCGGYNVCMLRIGVDEVVAAVDRILAGEHEEPGPTLAEDFFEDANWGPLGRVIRWSIEEVQREGSDPWKLHRANRVPALPRTTDDAADSKSPACTDKEERPCAL